MTDDQKAKAIADAFRPLAAMRAEQEPTEPREFLQPLSPPSKYGDGWNDALDHAATIAESIAAEIRKYKNG